MAYCTTADVVPRRLSAAELARLTTDDPEATDVDQDAFDALAAAADDEINAYLAVRYALPLSSTPAILSRIAGDLVAFQLLTSGGRDASETARAWYTAATKMLADLRDGKLELGLTAAGTDATGAANASVKARVVVDAAAKARANFDGAW